MTAIGLRWQSLARATLLVCGLLFVTSCSKAETTAADTGAADTTIYVVSNDWHTGIVLRRADLPAGRLPELADLPTRRYVEFGWGDEAFYQSRDTTAAMALRAALSPTSSVLHVAAFDIEPARAFDAEVLAFGLSADGLARLVDALDATFDRTAATPTPANGPGLYFDSNFYPATGRFHLFNTCNTWAARLLAQAGLDVRPGGVITSTDLLRQLRPLARR